MSSDSDKTNSNELSEQLPSKIKSHLPLHLRPRNKKPLESSTDVNKTDASTPALVKRRQVQRWFNSPTDAFLSPCSQKLMKPKIDNSIEPLNLDENDDQKQMEVDNHSNQS